MDKETLLTRRADTDSGMPEDDVEVPGMGIIVRVRALNRGEALYMAKIDDPAATERYVVACGMVDPVMTQAEVGQWQQVSPAGELEPVSNRIAELSGMIEGARKSGVPGVRDRSESGVHVPPGAEAGDDGGGASHADEQ